MTLRNCFGYVSLYASLYHIHTFTPKTRRKGHKLFGFVFIAPPPVMIREMPFFVLRDSRFAVFTPAAPVPFYLRLKIGKAHLLSLYPFSRSVVSCYPLRILLSKSFFAHKKPEHFCFGLCQVFMSFVFRSLDRFALFRSLPLLFCFLDHAPFLKETDRIFKNRLIAVFCKRDCVVLFFHLCERFLALLFHPLNGI